MTGRKERFRMITVADRKYGYVSVFDPDTGLGIRSNVFDSHGHDTGTDPFQGSFPELLDIGIMGRCEHGQSGRCARSGVECYQDGLNVAEENMPFRRFQKIIDECRGRTFQVALGGRGDPDTHPDFPAILRYARENGVVPNFTTSGFSLDRELLPVIREYCGAVAVSWYRSKYTLRAVAMLVSAGVKTNIHYCLSRSTIDEAIALVRGRTYPEGVNRIIFLLHKPVGLGRKENVLTTRDPRVRQFFSLFDSPEYANIAGFDSCSVPALLAYTEKIHPATVEPCEAARFSAYIAPDFTLYPCSFARSPQFGVSLRHSSIARAWHSEAFERFRESFSARCTACARYRLCLGGCPVLPEITLCTDIDNLKSEVST